MRSLWPYWAPGHMRDSDIAYFKQLDPGGIRVYEADYERMRRAAEALPNATLFPRRWEITEEQSKPRMQTHPVELGVEHAQYWDARLKEWAARGLTLSRDKIYCVGVNEPRVWPDPHIDRRVHWNEWYTATMRQYDVINKYNVSLLNKAKEYGIHMSALNTSVGWITNLHDEEPSWWAPLEPIHEALSNKWHVLTVHEYWWRLGPHISWGWHAGRFAHIPWQDVRIVIGECGIENMVDQKRMELEGLPRGWKGSVSAEEYARQLNVYMRTLDQDSRVWGAFVFLTDVLDPQWLSQDTGDAHNQIIASLRTQTPAPLPLITPDKLKPITIPGGLPNVDPAPGKDFMWPIANAANKITQHWGRNPASYTRFGLKGHNGLDFSCITGTPVISVADGVVMMVATDPDYGNYARIYHEKYKVCSFYAHLRDANVVIGQTVSKGQVIGASDDTGNSTGPHLHLEIRKMISANVYDSFNTGFGNRAQMDPFTFLKMFA